jgi:hypothetical protein
MTSVRPPNHGPIKSRKQAKKVLDITMFSKISLIGTNLEMSKFMCQTRHGAKLVYIISELLQKWPNSSAKQGMVPNRVHHFQTFATKSTTSPQRFAQK